MIPYYQEIRDEKTNYTYSIDNVVIKGKIPYGYGDFQQEILSFLQNRIDLTYTHFETGAFASYRHQFNFQLDTGRSFFLGVGFNTAKGTDPYIGLDFNPNKTMRYADFAEVFNFVITRCQPVIKRFDFAVDIPVLRSNIFVRKNRRKLSEDQEDPHVEIRNSWEDHTTYLGRRSTVGYLKLYNKQRESKLNQPVSRLEITMPPEWGFDEKYLPDVRYFDDLQMVFNELKLTGTDRALLMASFENPDLLSMIGRTKRDKLLEVLDSYTHQVKINTDIYDRIVRQVWQYCSPVSTENYVKAPDEVKATLWDEMDLKELEL